MIGADGKTRNVRQRGNLVVVPCGQHENGLGLAFSVPSTKYTNTVEFNRERIASIGVCDLCNGALMLHHESGQPVTIEVPVAVVVKRGTGKSKAAANGHADVTVNADGTVNIDADTFRAMLEKLGIDPSPGKATTRKRTARTTK